ncbi:MAG: VanZ family protein [Spirochaetaceae bacterium]|nr:VanZ family protein [Spirochaetaceae bacterium]
MAVIWGLSSQSILPQPKGILGLDKVQHIIAYLVLAGTVSLWFFRGQGTSYRWRTLFLIFFITLAYGAIDELHQYFVPGRDCNVWDWLADSLGAMMGTALAIPVMGWINKRLVKA